MARHSVVDVCSFCKSFKRASCQIEQTTKCQQNDKSDVAMTGIFLMGHAFYWLCFLAYFLACQLDMYEYDFFNQLIIILLRKVTALMTNFSSHNKKDIA